MCGIWGIFPKGKNGLTKMDLDLVPQIMVLTSLRGMDSTGVAVVSDAKSRARTIKQVGGPDYLLNEDAFGKVLDFAFKKGKVIFGHGRSATKGKITAKNAHPFTYEHITLVHNGTIHFGLETEMTEVETDVDSHALCVSIAKKGLVEALKEIMGAYALIVHDSKEGCVYVVRNDERPLSQLDLDNRRIIMSEESAALYLSKRNHLGAQNTQYFPRYLIYKYDIEKQEWSSNEELVEYHAKKYTPPKPPVLVGYTGGGTETITNPKRGSQGSPRTVAETVQLKCVGREAMQKGNLFRYEFVDLTNQKYFAMSSAKEDRVGQVCLAYGYQIYDIKDKYLPKDNFSFVRYRELDWLDPKELEEIKQSVEEIENDRELTFLNGKRLPLSFVQKEIMKKDCALCQGPLNLFKAHETILTADNEFICDECVAKGMHYSMGFCQ